MPQPTMEQLERECPELYRQAVAQIGDARKNLPPDRGWPPRGPGGSLVSTMLQALNPAGQTLISTSTAKAPGRRPRRPKRDDGFDSGWEAKFNKHLCMEFAAGFHQAFFYHAMKLGVEDSWYTPDFLVIPNTGKWMFMEVKAHWESRDRRIWNQVRNKYARLFEFRVVRYEPELVIREDWVNPPKKVKKADG